MPIKEARSLIPLAFYSAVTIEVGVNNEELSKTVENLAESVKSMQDQLMMLTRGATHNGTSPQYNSSLQNSSTNLDTSLIPPPNKKTRLKDEEDESDEELEEVDTQKRAHSFLFLKRLLLSWGRHLIRS